MQNGGDTAEQLVRMALSGGEMAVRLGASAIKNTIAFLLALRQNGKKVVHGRMRLPSLLKHTRDLRTFEMTKERFEAFRKNEKGLHILYAATGDKDKESNRVDLILPTSEVDRANIVFEKIGYFPKSRDQEKEAAPDNKKKNPGHAKAPEIPGTNRLRARAAAIPGSGRRRRINRLWRAGW